MIEAAGQEGFAFFTRMAEFLPMILYVYDVRQEKVIFSNRLAQQFIDHDSSNIYHPEGFFLKNIFSADKIPFLNFLDRCREAGDGVTEEIEYRVKQQDGDWHWYRHSAIVFNRYEDGSACLILNLAEDISERKRNEETLLRFSTALKMTSDSILITDLSNKILDVNDAAIRLYGAKNKEELIGRDWFDFVLADDRQIAIEGMQKVLINGFLGGRELRLLSGQPESVPVEVSISIITNARRAFTGLVIITRDITERKKAEEKLRYISSFDPLTRIYNRFSYQEKILQIQNSDFSPVSVLMIDADGLKKVNDSQGHSVGDTFLIAIADTLKKSFRQDDFIARIGGDEFVVILPGTNEKDLQMAIQRLNKNLAAANRELQTQFELSVSIGGFTVERGSAIQQALFYADEQMYAEKLKKKADKNA